MVRSYLYLLIPPARDFFNKGFENGNNKLEWILNNNGKDRKCAKFKTHTKNKNEILKILLF